ncbi:hypothetical protein [Mesorhizobium erdmanii]|uniref:hypothetical protein n=1 Tax=Mesorhizobium erdmanii TaxID=1777866 RepID=UPI0012B6118A|nr:hypothetical protein [Mesorhizobium erdmanii]
MSGFLSELRKNKEIVSFAVSVRRRNALAAGRRFELRNELEQTYAWFLRHIEEGDVREKGDVRLGAA